MATKVITKKIKIRDEDEVVSMGRLAFRHFMKNKLAIVGASIFIIIVLMVVFAPLITPKNGDLSNLDNVLQPPSKDHILGTDPSGRDMWTRLVYGGRNSMLVATLSTMISVFIGAVVGAISGYYGGWVDNVLMRFAEVFQSIPYLPTMIVVSFALAKKIPPEKRVYLMGFIIGVLSWVGLARMVRAQLLSLREQEFMEAATALGLSDFSKVFKHLLPNTFGYIMVNATLSFAGGILSETSLSFLGLGVMPPNPSWGNILQYAQQSKHLNQNHWWLWIPCAVFVILTVLGINLFGEGLRDAFDPKSNK